MTEKPPWTTASTRTRRGQLSTQVLLQRLLLRKKKTIHSIENLNNHISK
jgi:hypothetical protein